MLKMCATQISEICLFNFLHLLQSQKAQKVQKTDVKSYVPIAIEKEDLRIA